MNCRTLDCPACGRPFSVYDSLPDAGHICPFCQEKGLRAMFSDILDFFRRWWRQRRPWRDSGGDA